jgi:hypothetical protein
MTTWDYTSQLDEAAPEDLPAEWVWERLRNRRDALLATSDFRMVADAPWDTVAWAEYRQALRDLPDVTTDPRQAAWPTPPE